MTATTAAPTTHTQPQMLERLPTDPEAIFVSGVARSGTTMMRYLLETSPRIAIAHENHFISHVLGRRGARHYFRRAGGLAGDDAVRRVVDMIYSGEYDRQSGWLRPSPYWHWLVESVPRDEVERRLLAAERSERGLFREFLRIYADAQGKPVMGEKTPTHLNDVDTLVEWFPGARVIHMLRDPRAIYVSDRYRRQKKGPRPFKWLDRVPFALETYLLLLTVVAWRRATRLHARLATAYPGHYRLVRFEDVVQHADKYLPQVFAFVGVEMPDAARFVRTPPKHGMRSKEQGIDPDAATRWREHIHPFARRILELFLSGPMRRYGYVD